MVFLCFFLFFLFFVFFLMIRRPPRSTLDRSSAASDVYKRQIPNGGSVADAIRGACSPRRIGPCSRAPPATPRASSASSAVSYTHLRAHETVLDLVCRLLLEKKNNQHKDLGHILYNNPTTQRTTLAWAHLHSKTTA